MTTLGRNLERSMIQWRHDLHRHPELGFEEQRTSALVAETLQSFGIEVVQNIGKTGVLGILSKGRSNRSIGLRADLDALAIEEENLFEHRSCHPATMHACGHDGHTSMLLGAAKHLSAHGQFSGTVYFIFQPAEEHGNGALSMIKDGLFENWSIDTVHGLHNLPGLTAGHFVIRPGPIMASESSFEIRISGKGGHAAMPHTGVDSLLVAAQIVVALQSIVSRNLNALDETAVLSVTELITDGTVNVIPSQVTLKGDYRCFSDPVLNKIQQAMERIVSGICAAAGAEYDFDCTTAFPPTINSPEETRHAIQAASQALGATQVNGSCAPFTLSDDFAHMLRVKPGSYALIGNGDAADNACLHNPHYDFNDSILLKGANYWVHLVENQLAQ